MIRGGGGDQASQGQLVNGSEYAGRRAKPSTCIRSHGAGRADGLERGRRGAVAATGSRCHDRPLPIGTMSLRVGFCSLWDPLDPNQWSGYAFSMRQALLEHGCDLVDIAPVDPGPRSIDWARKLSARAAGRFYHWDREPAYLERVAANIDRRCRNERLDVLFAPSSLPLARVRATIPKAFATDQVFPALLEGYLRSPARRYVRFGLEQERAALAGASFASFPSAWAADQAVTRCGAARERVLLIHWGANLADEPSEREVAGFLERRRRDRPCKLVFIGRDWRRKGGDVVVATVRELERRGTPCRLVIVGTQPPEQVPASSIVVPFFDKRRPDQARRFSNSSRREPFSVRAVPRRGLRPGILRGGGFRPARALELGGWHPVDRRRRRNGISADAGQPPEGLCGHHRGRPGRSRALRRHRLGGAGALPCRSQLAGLRRAPDGRVGGAGMRRWHAKPCVADRPRESRSRRADRRAQGAPDGLAGGTLVTGGQREPGCRIVSGSVLTWRYCCCAPDRVRRRRGLSANSSCQR